MTMVSDTIEILVGCGMTHKYVRNVGSLRLCERVWTSLGAWESACNTERHMDELVDCNVEDHAALAENDSADDFDDLMQRQIRRIRLRRRSHLAIPNLHVRQEENTAYRRCR